MIVCSFVHLSLSSGSGIEFDSASVAVVAFLVVTVVTGAAALLVVVCSCAAAPLRCVIDTLSRFTRTSTFVFQATNTTASEIGMMAAGNSDATYMLPQQNDVNDAPPMTNALFATRQPLSDIDIRFLRQQSSNM
jgi:hypothetical protein